MSAKQRLHELVEQLPASEVETAVELLESLVEAPVDPEMLARIDAARQKRGAGIRDDEQQKAQEKLEGMLMEGIQSGGPTEMTRQDWADIRQEGLKQFEALKARTRA